MSSYSQSRLARPRPPWAEEETRYVSVCISWPPCGLPKGNWACHRRRPKSARGAYMPSVDEVIAIKERVEAQFLGAPGVTGVDVGYKEVGGQRTEQVSIRVHVAQKTDNVPDDQRVPAEIEGVATDVLERRYEPQVLAQQVITVRRRRTPRTTPPCKVASAWARAERSTGSSSPARWAPS